MLMPYPLR